MSGKYCLDCKDRHPGCHSNCSKYEEYKKELEKINKNKDMESLLKRRRRYISDSYKGRFKSI